MSEFPDVRWGSERSVLPRTTPPPHTRRADGSLIVGGSNFGRTGRAIRVLAPVAGRG